MGIASDPFEDSALVYTRLVRQVSQEAAATVEQIHATFGSHAALRVALIVTILQIEIHENCWIPNIHLYDHLLDDYADALPLAHYAMTCCLESWSVSIGEPNAGQNWQAREP